MSAPGERETVQAADRIMERVAKALGPFQANQMMLFEYTIKRPEKERPGFYETLYSELPRRLQRRILLLDIDEPAPTSSECRRLEREILGYARRKLMREMVPNLIKQIKSLPHLPGRNGGRPTGITNEERRRIQQRVKELMQSGDEGEPMSKTKAIKVVADQRGISPRHVWRIVLGH